jgi:hypothetical protein
MSEDDEDGWSDELPWIGQYVLDENGNAVRAPGLLDWARWMETHDEQRCLARDRIGNVTVSTVFLGLDHGLRFLRREAGFDEAAYKPILWETMMFGGQHDQFQNRYTSREDALLGHRKIVQMLTS